MDKSELVRWRSMEVAIALELLVDHVKEDRDFRPLLDPRTRRFHVSAAGRDWELLLTGAKWFDTGSSSGSGGAIDLAMHLWAANFKQAVTLLQERNL